MPHLHLQHVAWNPCDNRYEATAVFHTPDAVEKFVCAAPLPIDAEMQFVRAVLRADAKRRRMAGERPMSRIDVAREKRAA